MYIMNPVIISIAKDFYGRLYHWVQTLLELFLPVVIVALMNLTMIPYTDSPFSSFTNDTIYRTCDEDEFDIFLDVLYEPSNKFTDALMSRVKCLGRIQVVRPGNIHDTSSDFYMGLIFKGAVVTNSLIPDSLQYELFPTSDYWGNIYQLRWDSSGYMNTYTYGRLKRILKLMHAIDEGFLQLKNISTPKEISFRSMDMYDSSLRAHKIVVLAAFFFGFLFMVPAVVGRLVQEKCSGVKEIVLMMGLKKWHLWAGKLFDCVMLSGTSMLLMLIFLYVPLTKHSQVLRAVDFCLMGTYLYFALFGVFVFLCFMSCLFNNPMVAVLTTQVVWGISFALFMIMSLYSSKISLTFWLICCLFPHFSFFTGLSILLDFDYYGKEVNPGEILSMDPNYPTFFNVMCMILFEIIFYLFLGLYLEEVMPGKFGIPKPFNFCLKKSYWFPSKKNSENTNSESEDRVQNVDFESVPDGMNVGISIRNLSKEYKSLSKSPVLAVDNISIDFYSGEIIALLGHNGAGKTTVFSAISGLTHATSGQILINGYDVVENTDEARKSFGYCPQHDMLFEDLTPFDNLRFFAMAKGIGLCDAPMEAYKFLGMLKLNGVGRSLVSKLSLGQKRKLSLGIALIGGSDVVLLDEPTSGLDPEMRREIWEILLSLKGTKTILFTTHSMEEADILSDRIAIMDHGKIICYGTPMYLKSKYGSGYTLSVVIKNIEKAQDLTQFIQTYVKTAKLIRQNVLTLTYQLPEEETANFAMVFAGLNNMQDSHEIQSYSLNFSTFEDVFIRLRTAASEDTRIDMIDHSQYKRLNCSDEVHLTKINSFLLPLHQFYALLIKKRIYFCRNIGSYLMFSIIALLLVLSKFYIIPVILRNVSYKPVRNYTRGQAVFTYSLDPYGNSTALYSIDSENELSRSFTKYLGKHGWETGRVGDVQKGLEKIFHENFYSYMTETKFAVEFDEDKVKIFHNSYAVHILPIALNSLYNSILLANNVSGEITTSVNLKYSHKENKKIAIIPLPKNLLYSCKLLDIPDYVGFQVLFYLIGPIRERFFGAKHLQLMTTSSTLYWLTHLLFDSATFVIYLLVPTLLIGLSKSYDAFLQNMGEVYFALILWGIGLILFTYILSTFMTKSGLASATYLTVYIIFTFLVYPLIRWNWWPKVLMYLHPSCMLKMRLINICTNVEGDYYTTGLIIYNIVLFAFLVLKDCHILSDVIHRGFSRIFKVDYKEPVDKDPLVKDQEELVKNLRNSEDVSSNSLIVDDLKRWHFKLCGRRPTVKGISFTVKHGECFGLLGVNGAGKTTSFKMMTGDIAASQGQVFVNGYNVLSPTERSTGLFEIGYCPERDGFIPTLKGKELLALFARLRGVRECDVSREAVKWAEELDLMEYADTPIENYSGGNKRKLLVGIALIGNPAVIFLDEPTSGVDPVTRRILWGVISNLRAEGKSILFTSHSMDECEAICTRLAIMVRGSFRCFGEITTLKDTFGQGYTVQLKIKLGATIGEFAAIKEAMSSEFDPGCELIDEHLTMLQYHITNRAIKWDKLFLKLISMKHTFDKLESFNASSTTLEQIFISFVKKK